MADIWKITAPQVHGPYRSENRERAFYCCRGCGKTFSEVSSIQRHQAQYCRKLNTSYRESERPVSETRLLGG